MAIKLKNIFDGNFGIEKESLRVDKNGVLVKTLNPIPNKSSNRFLTVDFAEQQIEVISNIWPSIEKAITEIQLLDNIMYRQIKKGEYFWHYSLPYKGIENAFIASGSEEFEKYRQDLLKTSNFETQLISGVHFNFSFSDKLINNLTDEENNEFYYKLFNKYLKYEFLISQLFGMSPTKDFKTFDKVSYRMDRKTGYYNNYFISHSAKTYSDWKLYINELIKNKKILEWRSIYESIRLKPLNTKRVKWIEIRNIDLDFTKTHGIDSKKLSFLHEFLVYLAFSDKPISHTASIPDIMNDVKKWLVSKNRSTEFVDYAIKKMYEKEMPSVKKIIGKQIKHQNTVSSLPLYCCCSLELSTQLLLEEAYLEGKDVRIIDFDKNVLAIQGNIFKQATLTEFDSEKGLEIISNKKLTNHFLKKHNYLTTDQKSFVSKQDAYLTFEEFKNKKIVIKPANTNFSDGLTVLNYNDWTETDFREAIDFSFKYDDLVLIEKFVKGKEYRFLVIGDKVSGVLYREPAGVLGDGKSTIKELVEITNKHPYRGVHYKLPLEKIKLGKTELSFLKANNHNVNYIPKKGEKIFLRKNSNVSTGGSTYDMTDQVNEKFNKLAVEVTKKLNLAVCGLDIIIPNIAEFKEYSILELNWNPAIHIHRYPLHGKGRNAAKDILALITEEKTKDELW